ASTGILFLGVDNLDSSLRIATEQSDKTLHLRLGVANEACADLKIPGPRRRTEQRSQQCEQQCQARCEAHQKPPVINVQFPPNSCRAEPGRGSLRIGAESECRNIWHSNCFKTADTAGRVIVGNLGDRGMFTKQFRASMHAAVAVVAAMTCPDR